VPVVSRHHCGARGAGGHLSAKARSGDLRDDRSTDTTGLTRKSTELTRTHVTTSVQDRFSRESDRLNVERVILQDSGGHKGKLLHTALSYPCTSQHAPSAYMSYTTTNCNPAEARPCARSGTPPGMHAKSSRAKPLRVRVS
jgi:hypothetical protein